MKRKNIFRISVALGLIISVVVFNFTAFARDCREIRKNTLRLHVIANSDSEEDQALKLLVRDRILKETGDLFLNSQDKDESISLAKENMELIISAAKDEILKAGKDQEVTAEICEMFFETRVYGDVTMPAGRYNALRVKIGESKGKNWWCVLFPPLCLPSCTADDEALALLEPVSRENANFKVKFYFVEVLERIKEWWK